MTFPVLVLTLIVIVAASYAAARIGGRWAIAATVGGALMLLAHAWGYFQYTSDDAYISYRYARHLADGLGLVWNPGDDVEGYSNFLWVLILAGAHRIGADIVPVARWLGFALAVAALPMTFFITRILLTDPVDRAEGVGTQRTVPLPSVVSTRPNSDHRPPTSSIAGFVAVMLLAASGPYALWSTAGLEAPLLAVLVLAGALLHIREHDDPSRVPWSAAIWALAAMTRPDAPLLFAVSAAFKLADATLRVRAADADERRDAVLRELGAFGVYVAIFAVIYVPYFIWRYATYGYLFPNTYYAKVGGGIEQYERGLLYLEFFAREYAAWLLLLAPVAMAIGRVRRAAMLYGLALVLAYGAYIVHVGGDSLVRFRLFVPVLPLFYAVIAASAVALVRAINIERAPRWTIEAVTVAAIAGFMLFMLAASKDENVEVERDAVDGRVAMGRWLRDTLPDDTVIAVIPAGAIPYESELETIDMLGINDEHIAHRDLPLGQFGAGHEKYDSEYVLDRQPDIIILTDAPEGAPRSREAYAELAGGIILARIDMLNTPRLWEEYEARAVQLEDGWLNLLARKDASAVLDATQAP